MCFKRYTHHGTKVWVRKDLKGEHRDHCLCYECAEFKPGCGDNCEMAAALYALCKLHGMVTPVWECPNFKQEC